ncbi:hypothetical protein [Pseudanabaena sp. FACHB-2040]|uniref:hypothetical protein n=1 Tax=Pseudanabaena sp. FACHB-2040 TaxID=2692859 RepID=UPI0016837F33|nr:hypothetical protein [Pseudanabaena sp. FACHB-2040]MBD0268244.1 hypothetical protein [Cyanobacteria bacterium Co-bin8]MBD2260081.1 hypothetical protein [Pseudanabaena sp. FACHB-2040]
MERGLLWLPLLAVFIGLAWAGRNEYQKVEAYKVWAQQFERAKYDIFAVLGQSGTRLTWGIPTRKGPVDLKTLSLSEVSQLTLKADGQTVDPEHPPEKARRSALVLTLRDNVSQEIPFTDLSLTIQWLNYLRREVQALQSASN